MNYVIPTVEEYRNAINALTKRQQYILKSLYSFPNSSATAKELANLLGYSGYQAANRQIGQIGRFISDYTGIIPPVYLGDRGEQPAYYLLVGEYNKSTGWRMWEELREALENLDFMSSEEELQNESLFTARSTSISIQNTYLFVWNPAKWEWTDIEENIEELQRTNKVTLKWSCRSHKSIRIGDRAFLAKVGSSPKGIMGSGRVVSEPFLSKHWSGEDKDVPRVLIEFDVLLNPQNNPILTLDFLDTGNLSKQTWTPQSSGISIKPEVVGELEEEWFEFLRSRNFRFNPLLEMADDNKTFVEGSAFQVLQTRYERNVYARDACLRHHGYTCKVCELNFEETYGNMGYKFIHVHHLTPVSTVGKEYKVNPVEDLRPVCPNCHAMLHRRNPPLTIEELREIIEECSDESED